MKEKEKTRRGRVKDEEENMEGRGKEEGGREEEEKRREWLLWKLRWTLVHQATTDALGSLAWVGGRGDHSEKRLCCAQSLDTPRPPRDQIRCRSRVFVVTSPNSGLSSLRCRRNGELQWG